MYQALESDATLNAKKWSPLQFSNHVELIRTFLEEKKQGEGPVLSNTKRQNWSLGSWARRLNLSSAAPLTNILKGRVLPSYDLAVRMAESMALDSHSTEYFILLIELERHKNSVNVIREAIQNRIAQLRTAL